MIHSSSLALLTDFYQLLMAYAYFKQNLKEKEAVFDLFFRRKPFNGGFAVAAGLETAMEFIENFKYDESDLAYLATLKDSEGEPYFDDQFLTYLKELKLEIDMDAVPEGTAVFPYEPLVRIRGPLIHCQLLESPLLNLINFSTLIATKAARIRIAAGNDKVMEFGLRRAQGIDGALTASRSAYIGGCDSTSNVLAGKHFGIPVRGTQAHSWIMVFDDEFDAFKEYAQALPGNAIFLVDTYDTIEGVKKAIEVGVWLRSQGKNFQGIRLDSGDLAYLSIRARQLLDENGFSDVKILASNELDETIISELKRQGAQITVWGVGTKLATGGNQPALDGVYKLSALRDPGGEWQDRIKLSEQMVKVSNPGILQVKRFIKEGEYIADMIYDINSPASNQIIDPFDPTLQRIISEKTESIDLLIPIYRQGKKVYSSPSLKQIKEKSEEELKFFHAGIKRFLNPHNYFVGLEKSLYERKVALIQSIRSQKL